MGCTITLLHTSGPEWTRPCLVPQHRLQIACRRPCARSLTPIPPGHMCPFLLQVRAQKLARRKPAVIALFVGKPNIITLPSPIPLKFGICPHLYRGYLTHDPAPNIGSARRVSGTESGAPGMCGLQSTPSIQRKLFINKDPLSEEDGTRQPRNIQTPMKQMVISVNMTVLI